MTKLHIESSQRKFHFFRYKVLYRWRWFLQSQTGYRRIFLSLWTGINSFIKDSLLQACETRLHQLSYCVWVGSSSCFGLLVERMHGSIQLMEENLENIKINTLHRICQLGFIDLLRVYVPIYITTIRDKQCQQDQSYTIEFTYSI